jgi:hypothetical protein
MPMAYLRRPRRVSIDFHQTNAKAPDQGNAIMQKWGFCLYLRAHPIQSRDFRALCNQRQHRIESRTGHEEALSEISKPK